MDKIGKGAKIALAVAGTAKAGSDMYRGHKTHQLKVRQQAWVEKKFNTIFYAVIIGIAIIGVGTGGFFLVKNIFFGKSKEAVEQAPVAVETKPAIVENHEPTVNTINNIQEIDPSEVKPVAKKNVFQHIGGFFKKVFQSIGSFFKNVFQSIGRFLKNVFQSIGKFFKKVFQNIGSFFKGVFQSIRGFFKGIFQRGSADVIEIGMGENSPRVHARLLVAEFHIVYHTICAAPQGAAWLPLPAGRSSTFSGGRS